MSTRLGYYRFFFLIENEEFRKKMYVMSSFLSKLQVSTWKFKVFFRLEIFNKIFPTLGKKIFFCLFISNDCLKASRGRCRSKASGIKQIKHTETTIILLSSSYKVQQNSVTWLWSHQYSVAESGKFFWQIPFWCWQEKDASHLTMILLKRNKDKSLQSFFQSTSYCCFVCMVHCQTLGPVFTVHRLLPINIAKSV